MIWTLLTQLAILYFLIAFLVMGLIFVRVRIPLDTWAKRGMVIAVCLVWLPLLGLIIYGGYLDIRAAQKTKGF